MWRELIIRQGFPVREQHHRRVAAGQVKAEGVRQLLGATTVGGQHHKQVILAARQFGQHRGHAAGSESGPVFIVLSPAGKEVAVGE